MTHRSYDSATRPQITHRVLTFSVLSDEAIHVSHVHLLLFLRRMVQAPRGNGEILALGVEPVAERRLVLSHIPLRSYIETHSYLQIHPDDAMTLHWWMHWFWVTAQFLGESSHILQFLSSDASAIACMTLSVISCHM